MRLKFAGAVAMFVAVGACSDDTGDDRFPGVDDTLPAGTVGPQTDGDNTGGDAEPPASSDGGSEDTGEPEGEPFDASFIEAQVDAALAAGVPGLAVAVVAEGEVVYAQGHGIAGPAGSDVDAKTLFNLASVSKSVTAMAMLSLRDDGLLATSDAVKSHVPYLGFDAAFDASSVTIAHVLTHTSGVGDYETEPFVLSETLATSFAMNANQPLWATPGLIYNYSNRGYALAGLVVAEVAGSSFADAVATRVFQPLGMADATMDAAVALTQPHAEGRTYDGWAGPSDYLGELYQPPAGLWASAEDLGGLVVGLLGQPDMMQPHQPTHEWRGAHYGYGLFVEAGGEPLVAHHGGSTGGYLSDVSMVPSQQFGVAVVINTDDADAGSIANAILEHYTGPSATIDIDLPELDSALVPGSYTDPWQLGQLEISPAFEINFVDLGTTVPMIELWPGAWFIEDPLTGYELDITFWPDATGAPTHMVTRRGIATKS